MGQRKSDFDENQIIRRHLCETERVGAITFYPVSVIIRTWRYTMTQEDERLRTQDLAKGIAGHLEHVQTRAELIHYLGEQLQNIRLDLRVDKELRKSSR